MASKRGLYKPATQKEVSSRDRGRKPLVQGRLVTQRSFGDGEDHNSGDNVVSRQQVHSTGDASYIASLTQSARRDLSSLLKADTPHHSDQTDNPRRVTPQVTVVFSGNDSRPSELLDLSDTDSEVFYKDRDVLIVDAFQHTNSSDSTGIDVQLQYGHSPVKVVCHSPSKRFRDIRNTGDAIQTCQVTMDTLPRVSILGNDDNSYDNQHNSDRSLEHLSLADTQPLVVRENVIVGHPGDSDMQQSGKSLLDHILDEDSASSINQPSVMSVFKTSLDTIDQSSEASDTSGTSHTTDPTSSHQGAVGGRAPPKTKSAALSTSNIKSKKKVRIVPSRYMQAASQPKTKPGPMKATDRSIMTKTSSTANTSRKSSMSHSRRTPTPSRKKSSTSSSNPQSTFSMTPEVKGQGGKVSTPSNDGSMFQAPGVVDVSVIAPSGAIYHSLDSTIGLSDSHLSSRSNSSHCGQVVRQSESDRGSLCRQPSTAKHDSIDRKVSPPMTQQRLDMAYFRYLQWAFLESRAKKCFQEQEKQVMGQFYALDQEIERLQTVNDELDLDIARIKHVNKLDEMLDVQVTGLMPVVAQIPKVKEQYRHLADALDTTRHQLPAKGVLIPSDDHQFAQSLLRGLHESEELLGQINNQIQSKQESVTKFAETISTMENTLSAELQEIDKCKELLAAMKTLSTQENSLYIQEMQEKEE